MATSARSCCSAPFSSGRSTIASRSSTVAIPARRRSRSAGIATTPSRSCLAPSSTSRSASSFIPSSSASRSSARRRIRIWRMSARDEIKRLTAPDIRARKGGEPIVSLTSYHAHTARILDQHCDLILVGDSLGMVMHGLETTIPVTLDMMILQGLAVMRGSKRALVVVDMPFGSYEASREQAFARCARVMKETHCGAIKLEGGRRMADTIAFLAERGIPVMGHVGLTPQSINALGGFRTQGRDPADWEPIQEDARAVGQAGAFAVVLEALAEPLAAKITRDIPI